MTSNPYLDRVSRRGKSSHGKASEKRVAKELGARQTVASGAMDGQKGDLLKQAWRGESKSTIHDSLSLKYEWLTKITREASSANTYPLVTISFVTETGLPKKDGDWVLIPMWVLNSLEEFK